MKTLDNAETCSYVLRMAFTLADMHRFAQEAWGPFGANTVTKWDAFNRRFFAGTLAPVPLVLTHTQPFGSRLAFCSHSPSGRGGRTITLNVPSWFEKLVADNGVLLHEMIHQHLHELDEPSGHDSQGWRLEIMRLHKLITGRDLWAGRSKTVRRNKRVVRINEPHPDGTPSLGQDDIAHWPHSQGIVLGSLGSTTNAETQPEAA